MSDSGAEVSGAEYLDLKSNKMEKIAPGILLAHGQGSVCSWVWLWSV